MRMHNSPRLSCGTACSGMLWAQAAVEDDGEGDLFADPDALLASMQAQKREAPAAHGPASGPSPAAPGQAAGANNLSAHAASSTPLVGHPIS